MLKDKRVLVVGSSNMDLSMNVCRIPSPGETVIDDGGVSYTPGGKGANAAIAFRKLGAESIFCTRLGADLHGQKLYSYFKEQQLNTSYIKVDKTNPTGFAAIMKDTEGQNRIIYYPGANLKIAPDSIAEAFTTHPDALYVGFESSFDTALYASRIASANAVPIFVDAAPADKNYPLESLPPVEVFSPNETETLEYTGILPIGAESSLRAAHALFRRVKCKYIVIKQGARGVFIYDGKHYSMVPSYRPDKIVDTVAAGDAFTAAMTLKYLECGNIIEACRYGAAAGAIVVSRVGASVAMPTEREIVEFIAKRPIQ